MLPTSGKPAGRPGGPLGASGREPYDGRVSKRRGYGDETWRLALDGDAPALHRAADLLLEGDLSYDGHRARAFARGVEGDADAALAQLNEGWAEDWPFPAAYAADIARVRYLVDDYDRSLDALRLAAHGAERLDPAVADLVAAVVERAPRLRFRALGVVLGGGTPWQRVRNAAAVAVARG
jgi:hypothetical protein